MSEEENRSGRLMSLDALRGFDMWFITGGALLVGAICRALGAGDGWLAKQMNHVPWEGLAHHDTIFPLFLFLAGVSWPFSLAAQRAKNRTAWQIHGKILRRVILLYVFSVCVDVLSLNPNFRLPGVLAFIGLSWGLAALIHLHVRRAPVRLAIVLALLLGYWALLSFTLAPDAPPGAGSYSKMGNIVSWLDRTLMPNHIWVRGVYDPESFFSLAGGVSMAILGTLAGCVLKDAPWTPGKKAGTLFVAALATLALDGFFIFVLGDVVVKALWSPSFVLSAAAYSLAMLALFYWIVDVRGWRGWTLYFRVIGLNAITVYMAQRIIGFDRARNVLFGGLSTLVPEAWKGVVLSLGYLAVVWLFLYFLYRKKIFLKV